MFASAENHNLRILTPLYYVHLPFCTVSEKLRKERRKQADLWNTFYAPIVWRSKDKFHYEREIQSLECVDTDY